jgi:hypothetical protein
MVRCPAAANAQLLAGTGTMRMRTRRPPGLALARRDYGLWNSPWNSLWNSNERRGGTRSRGSRISERRRSARLRHCTVLSYLVICLQSLLTRGVSLV